MSAAATQPILHLTSINPYVSVTLNEAQKSFLARQPAPNSSVLSGPPLWGVSAFAFQGTNAHAILRRNPTNDDIDIEVYAKIASLPWAKDRFWYAPPPSPLAGKLSRVTATGIIIETSLTSPMLAYIRHHVVSGRILVPGAALLEAAASGLGLIAGSATSTTNALIVGVSIPAPLELSSTDTTSSTVMQFKLVTATGKIGISSVGPGSALADHMHCTAAVSVVSNTKSLKEATTTTPSEAAMLLSSVLLAWSKSNVSLIGGTVANLQCQRLEGRVGPKISRPAYLDAAFHLGALETDPSTKNLELRVPATIGAYQSGPQNEDAPVMFGVCQQLTASQRSTVSNFGVIEGRSSVCSVQQLDARPFNTSSSVRATARRAVSVSSKTTTAASVSTALYSTSWRAAMPVAVSSFAADTVPNFANPFISFNDCTTLDAQQLFAAGLATVQQADTGLLLSTTGMQSVHNVGFLPPQSASALLYGLLKTVGQEVSQLPVSVVDRDAQTMSNQADSLSFIERDLSEINAHGVATRAAIEYQPGLLSLNSDSTSERKNAAMAFHLMPMPRGAISSLAPQPVAMEKVAAGQVLMAVKAVGVNFRYLFVSATLYLISI